MSGTLSLMRFLPAFLVVLVPVLGLALMPPHVTKTVPGDGGVLEGDVVLIEGFSLKYANIEKRLKIVASTGKVVPFSHALACRSVGECDDDSKPGACQQKCELKVTLKDVPSGTRMTLTFLKTKITFSKK